MHARRGLEPLSIAFLVLLAGCGPSTASSSPASGPRAPAVSVTTGADIGPNDGRHADVIGVYHAIPIPMKGESRERDRPKDYAEIVLADGDTVYLEPYGTNEARRLDAEIARFDGKRVRVSGTLHAIMPSEGQSLLAPCVSGIERVEEER